MGGDVALVEEMVERAVVSILSDGGLEDRLLRGKRHENVGDVVLSARFWAEEVPIIWVFVDVSFGAGSVVIAACSGLPCRDVDQIEVGGVSVIEMEG